MFDNLRRGGYDPDKAMHDCGVEYAKRIGFQEFYLSEQEAIAVLRVLDRLIVESQIKPKFYEIVLEAVGFGGYYVLHDGEQTKQMAKVTEAMERHDTGWRFRHVSMGVHDSYGTRYRLVRNDK